MTDRQLTPTKITAWLDCAHFLTLTQRVEDGLLAEPSRPFGSFARLLADKGLQHEADCLAEYTRQGKSILQIPARERGELFTDWVARVGNPLDAGCDVIYQMPFVHDGMRGIADFVVRVEDPETGAVSYEPVDAKLDPCRGQAGTRSAAVLLRRRHRGAHRVRPRRMHLWLGSGRPEPLPVKEFRPYWRRLRGQLATRAGRRARGGTRSPSRARTASSASSPSCDDAVARRGLAHLRRRHPPGRTMRCSTTGA